MKKALLVFLIIIAAIFIRFVNLNEVPAGLYVDEASLGYSSYSLILTGKDEYGKAWPVFFRSFATFQSPLYVYLSTIPIKIFDLSIFSTRFISAVSGVLIIILSFFLIKRSIITLIVLSFSPWSIFVSRSALEAHLGLALFILSLFLVSLSLKKIQYFIPASLVMGLSSYAYHGERVFGIIFLLSSVFLFRNYFKKFKLITLIALLLFFVIQIPQFLLVASPGSLRRLQTQGYFDEATFKKNGDALTKIPLGREIYISRQFVSQYLSSYSPRSLFFEPEPQKFRSIPDLAVFYFWMLVPFMLGVGEVWRKRSDPVIKLIILSIVFGPIAAALTGDPFYSLRMLPMLWGISIVIAFGIKSLLDKFNLNIKIALSLFLIILSALLLYSSYFVLLKKERSYSYGYPYMKLAEMTQERKSTNFVLDTEVYDAPYILMAFYKKADPASLQDQADPEVLKNYYTNTTFNKYRKIGNVDVRPIKWGVDECNDEIFVADEVTLSKEQATDHHFTLEFELKDLTGQTILWGYQAHPSPECAIIAK